MRRAVLPLLLLAACSPDAQLIDGETTLLDAPSALDGIPDDLMVDPAIWFGTAANASRHNAIVALIDGWGNPFCSGSLIRDDVVLTAAHCVDGTGVWGIAGGQNLWSPAGVPVFPGASYTIHPGWNRATLQNDIAVLELATPVPNTVRPLYPAVTQFPLRAADVGRTGEAIGYGNQENGDFGERMHTDVPIIQIDPTVVWTDSSQSGTCYGDSGGALMVRIDGALRIAGVTSFVQFGPQDCNGLAGFTRVDAYTAFLSQF